MWDLKVQEEYLQKALECKKKFPNFVAGFDEV